MDDDHETKILKRQRTDENTEIHNALTARLNVPVINSQTTINIELIKQNQYSNAPMQGIEEDGQAASLEDDEA